MTYPHPDAAATKSSRIALAVVLSTMSVAAIAGPLAYQALEARSVNVGPAGNDGSPDVGGVTTQRTTTELVETTPAPSVDDSSAGIEERSTVAASAPTGTQTPDTQSRPAPSTAPTVEEKLPPPSVSSDPPSAERSTTAPLSSTEAPDSSLQIPSSPGTSPTWVPGEATEPTQDPTTLAPSTTSPNSASTSVPPSTDGSTSGSVTTAGPALPPTTVSDPLEPADPTTSTTVPDTSVVTEPLEPVDPTTTTIVTPTTGETTTPPSTEAEGHVSTP